MTDATTEHATQRQKKKMANNGITTEERMNVDDKMMQNDSSETNRTDAK
jgi:hypothetical protein